MLCSLEEGREGGRKGGREGGREEKKEGGREGAIGNIEHAIQANYYKDASCGPIEQLPLPLYTASLCMLGQLDVYCN